MALASGLRASRDPRGKVFTIDCFKWNEWAIDNCSAAAIAGLSPEQRALIPADELVPKDGASFLSFFHAYTAPLADSIEVVDADLEHYEWSGERIDVLMVDAAKSWPVLDQIVRQFFPSLDDGAIVIHQDYKHWFCFWLHVVTERMIERGVLTVAENVLGTPTQGYRFHKRRFRAADYMESAFSDDEADQLVTQSMQRYRGADESLAVAGNYVHLLRAQKRHDKAQRFFTETLRAGNYVDNYGLHDFVMINPQWARPMAHKLPEHLALRISS
jgi:hypothetical protein